MKLVQTAEVLKLTGLSADQLREWTIRRGLIQPDVAPSGSGTRAKFTWQTVLLLRIAVVLRETFHVELQAHRDLFIALNACLSKASFPALRGAVLLIRAQGGFELVLAGERAALTGDRLMLELDPHLNVLSDGFGMVKPLQQLTLFPVMALR